MLIALNRGQTEYDVSYVLPLELVLRQPLENWNPNNIDIRNDNPTGSGTYEDPYSHASTRGKWFFTPIDIYELSIRNILILPNTTADTRYRAWITGPDNVAREYAASGIYKALPVFDEEDDFCQIRFPVHMDAIEDGPIGHMIARATKANGYTRP
jgi:hypothetical protein